MSAGMIVNQEWETAVREMEAAHYVRELLRIRDCRKKGCLRCKRLPECRKYAGGFKPFGSDPDQMKLKV
jgi:hypothetical protein